MKAEIVSIGEEVVLGSIADTNAAWLAQRLTESGYAVARHTAVGDQRADILDALRDATERSDAVVVTGGIGPTLDDITREVLAELAGVGLVESPEARRHVESFFERIGRPMAATNLRQALLPEGADLVPNPRGTAVGVRLRVNGAEVFSLPGVPIEMKLMYEASLRPALEGGEQRAIALRRLRLFGVGESTVAERLGDLMRRGANPEIGTQVERGVIGIRVLARSATREEAERLAEAAAGEVVRRVGEDLVFGRDDERIEDVVVRELERTGLTLATAESCTGGYLAGRLTDVPGVSRFFLEGAVTYSNASKTSRLGVPEALIARKGAVSPEVAEAMAAGMRERSGADLAIALTGIAGPGGGTDAKPVGLVHIALADACGVEVEAFRFAGRREEVKDRSAKTALNLARLRLREAPSR